MIRYTVALVLFVGTANASCPLLDPEIFRETLNNGKSEIVVDGTSYTIEKRDIPNFAIESPLKPKVKVQRTQKKPVEVCKYTRRIGKQKFGSFTLKEKVTRVIIKEDRRPVIIERSEPIIVDRRPVIVERSAPVIVVPGGGYYNHPRHHHHRHW
ncbi:hypothetical protein [Candidatus Odyssella acanthamoebae]|uniref:Uncharacterized protein n=1 Tax=Candidatus Odyssella acanthamoebae TaxID=91604 RepID=A0A077AXG6_9PROT|nr:hypothetical protein [Candidatus Paracaedibacter acanthamoebae]AIK96323.1 hypothetical protein ID47_05615 [Candidatus Paracaedibacter acanthamoebae]